MAAQSSDTSVFREKEPYRRAFHFIQSKLIQTLLNLKEWAVVGSSADERHHVDVFLVLKGIEQGESLTYISNRLSGGHSRISR